MPTIRYWAGAKAAAGVESEVVEADSVTAALQQVTAARPALGLVVPHCAVLVGGRRVEGDHTVAPDDVIELLPPFAGG
ncbi:MoaD/ThiS family protein [Yimella sp. cx-573]|nr:MoaD/ThiS family protein [Yimella sp. cx-573]